MRSLRQHGLQPGWASLPRPSGGEDFPLPALAAKLDGWVRELSAGRAFVLIRGFPVDVLSEAETELAYVGLGLHLGTAVSQNARQDGWGEQDRLLDGGLQRDAGPPP
jgi:hypothetical protein